MLFGHQALQAPKTFAHNQCHEVSDFFLLFVLILLFIMGAMNLGVATTCPESGISTPRDIAPMIENIANKINKN